MIKIIYPDGNVEYQDVRRLTPNDLFLVFGNWGTMRYLYTATTPSGKPVDFYIVYELPPQDAYGYVDHARCKPLNEKVLQDYGIQVYGTAIICKAEILDIEED